MSNEYGDWMWENRQDAKRVVVMLEDAIEILKDLGCFKSTPSIITQLSVAKHALINDREQLNRWPCMTTIKERE